MRDLKGSWVAIPTPYDSNGALNLPMFDRLLDFQGPLRVGELDLQSHHTLSARGNPGFDAATAHREIGDRTLACQRLSREGAAEIDSESRTLS